MNEELREARKAIDIANERRRRALRMMYAAIAQSAIAIVAGVMALVLVVLTC